MLVKRSAILILMIRMFDEFIAFCFVAKKAAIKLEFRTTDENESIPNITAMTVINAWYSCKR